MDLENLSIFVDVMNKGSFAAVARDRDLAPSTISRAISTLEDDLGIRLLNRTTRQIRPTEAGKVYFQQVEAIVDELEYARHITTDLGNNPTGELRLTASMTFGNLNIVPLMPEFMEKYPRLNVFLNLTDAVVDLVDEGIDLAVRLGKIQDTSLVATKLADLEYVIVASPDYLKKHGTPLLPDDILNHQCAMFQMPEPAKDWLFRQPGTATISITPSGRFSVTNALALKQVALADMGIAMVSKWSVWEEIKNGKLIRLFSDYEVAMVDFDNAVWLAYPSRKYLPLKVRACIDFLKSEFKRHIPWSDV